LLREQTTTKLAQVTAGKQISTSEPETPRNNPNRETLIALDIRIRGGPALF